MLTDLRRELLLIAVSGAALLLLASGCLATLESWRFSLQGLLPAGLCWALIVWQCWKRLFLNRHTVQAPLYPTLGMANRVTLARGWFIAETAGFFLNGSTHSYTAYLPALLYTLAALCDCLDGYLARRQQRVSLLGTEMDTLVDALGLVVAPLVAVASGKVHVSYLLVSAAYYLFQWGLHRRHQQGKPVYALPPSRIRRLMAGFQMGFVAAALYPPVQATVSQAYGVAFMLPLLIGFWLDWLAVSGKRTAGSGVTHRLSSLNYPAIMVPVRAVLIAALLQAMLGDKLQGFAFDELWFQEQPEFQEQVVFNGAPAFSSLVQSGFAMMLCLSMAGIALGVFGRVCAVVMIVILGWQFPFLQPDLFAWIICFGTVLVALLGTGHLSLLPASVLSRGQHRSS